MPEMPISWTPGDISESNASRFMSEHTLATWEELHAWSVTDRPAFWGATIDQLGIQFRSTGDNILDDAHGVEDARWLPGYTLNITESCFQRDADAPAIYHALEGREGHHVTTYGELEALVNRVANGLGTRGLEAGDHVGIYMPLCLEAVAAYLGCIRAGVVPVLIADSFTPRELARRLEITGGKAIFVYEAYPYGGKPLEIYPKVIEANAPPAIVVPRPDGAGALRDGDLHFDEFLGGDAFDPVISGPYNPISVLFSSGTTKDPKAIPWTQLTPIKCASDGFFHHDIHENDVVTWTTSMGWMMGPWVVFASLLNGASMALFTGSGASEDFGRFTADVPITMLGTIPSLVKVWRKQGLLEKFDWSVRVLSSTGEPSNADDYDWLMKHCDAPVVEYCGGTEIGGGYICGSVVHPAVAASFSSPCMGLDFLLLDPETGESSDAGEVYLIPPSLGISQSLLNKDHHEEYFAGCPSGPNGEVLRRHGDAMEQFERDGHTYFRSGGRVDDAMNLGGIKVSSVEIETVLNEHPQVFESAAISVRPDDGGPERLVAFAVPTPGATLDSASLKSELQKLLSEKANPLYRLSDIVPVDSLPRTASNKVMRRVLRKNYIEQA